MKGNIGKGFTLLAVLLAWVSCHRGRTVPDTELRDSLEITDSLESDTAFFFADEDEGLSLESHTTEVFADFIFAFTHNGRFQAERIRFPLPVWDLDGTEHSITSGRQFRSEFQLPANDYYTLILGDKAQMDIFQNDSSLTNVAFQLVHLAEKQMVNYNFARTDGRWFLESRTHTGLDAALSDFLDFYEQFTTDSLFQQEHLAEQLGFAMEDADEEDADIEGTIDRGQWPVFRPEMPSGSFVNIYFGQPYPNPRHIYLLQCGISNGMLDIFTFHKEEGRWLLTSYES